MIERKINSYKNKIYTAIAIFIFVLCESVFVLLFISNEKSKTGELIIKAEESVASYKKRGRDIIANLSEFEKLSEVWTSINPRHIEKTYYTANDVILFLNSSAKKYALKDFMADVSPSTNANSQQSVYYSVLSAKIKFGAVNEPAVLSFLRYIQTFSDYKIAIKKVELSRNIKTNATTSKIAIVEYEKFLSNSFIIMQDGKKHEDLPDFLKATCELEIVFAL